ncbi:hypothetical protein KCP77_08120 [Salmonella enterica subsp. enterica]|nr:hypothetical protein KCP77_08120 [Salmonella enterica subsp. enterica]
MSSASGEAVVYTQTPELPTIIRYPCAILIQVYCGTRFTCTVNRWRAVVSVPQMRDATENTRRTSVMKVITGCCGDCVSTSPCRMTRPDWHCL